MRLERELDECIFVLSSDEDDRPTISAIAAVRAAARNERFAAPADVAVSALAAANMKAYLSEGATAADCVARYLSGEARVLD